MLLEFLFVQMLFLPLICGSNVTLENTPNSTIITAPKTTDPVPQSNVTSKTKITIAAEGGAITQIDTNLTIPKNNSNIYMDLEKELGKSKNTTIVPRKGVNPEEFKDSVSAPTKSSESMDHEVIKNELNGTHNTRNDPKILNSSRIDTSILKNNADVKVNHKPTVLSYDALHNSGYDAQTAPKTSSKTIISDQIPNPNGHMKGESIDADHPGMIMPVVITILTVPLFAVLGYMALRRGQEAWKNRHYKRMDFLLDGMYND